MGGCSSSANFRGVSGIFDRQKQEARSGKLFAHNDITFDEWLPEIFRVLKDGGHCYIMINARNLKELWTAATQAGFRFQNLLVWRKNNATPSQFYMNQAEFILMLRKGRAKPILERGTTNCLDVRNIRAGTKSHPTEKPVELMEILIRNSSVPGDIVLDPFMGSGTTGIACRNLGRDFIGIEMDEEYFDRARRRVENNATD